MILAPTYVLAAALQLMPPTPRSSEPETPPDTTDCRTVFRMEKQDKRTLSESSVRVLRSLAGDAMVRNSHRGAGTQTFANRAAEIVRGRNRTDEYVEVETLYCRPNPEPVSEPIYQGESK